MAFVKIIEVLIRFVCPLVHSTETKVHMTKENKEENERKKDNKIETQRR